MDQFILDERGTKEEIDLVQNKLHEFNLKHTNSQYDQPGIEINQIIKDPQGKVIGGVNASTLLRVMHLEVLWVADDYRKFGLASQLVLGAECIGAEHGCISTQTMSFSFQAPAFYQKLGYKVLGIYSGYPFGIREYVLNKRLVNHDISEDKDKFIELAGFSGKFSISQHVTPQDMQVLHQGLHAHVVENIGDKYKGVGINLVIRKHSRQIVGGLRAYTTINNLILENMWVDEAYRGQGLGTWLLSEAENISQRGECTACQAICLSFQALDFFTKHGFEVYAISDSYPDPFREFHLVKRF